MIRGARRAALAAALFGCLLTAAGAAGQGVEAARSALIEQGRALFHGTRPYAAGDAATPLRLPVAMVACARCHGAGGEGRREGGVTAPPLRGDVLRHPVSGYADAAALIAAIATGRGRGGKALDPAMPHFQLSGDESSALLAYLSVLGSEADRPAGVTSSRVRLGTVLPLSGPGARIGQAVLASMRQSFDEVNAAGGVHGRTIELVVRDTGLGVALALSDLRAQDIYAVVGGLWREDAEPVKGTAPDDLLAQWQLAHIGSLVVRERAPAADAWSLDLLAPLKQQRTRLADALSVCTHALLVDDATASGAAAEVVGDTVEPLSTRAAVDRLRVATDTGCIGMPLASVAVLNGVVPRSWQRSLVLPLPAALMQGASGTDGPWPALGRVSARLAIELLGRAGRALHERSLLDRFDRPTDLSLIEDPGATLHYSRTRRHAWDAQVIALDTPPPRPTVRSH